MAKKIKIAPTFKIFSVNTTENEIGEAVGYSKDEAIWSFLRNEGLEDDAIRGVIKTKRYNGNGIIAREVKR